MYLYNVMLTSCWVKSWSESDIESYFGPRAFFGSHCSLFRGVVPKLLFGRTKLAAPRLDVSRTTLLQTFDLAVKSLRCIGVNPLEKLWEDEFFKTVSLFRTQICYER